MVSSSSSGSLKRNRAPSNGSMIASCLVEGCVSDLSKCREYHRRHKVCEIHSKTPIVMVGGREQRFCQQCSRFHLLVEFDEVKRSCRKRLEGHNRRRRKPQLNSLNSRSFMTNHQGNRLASYPRTFSITTPNPIWAPLVKEEDAPFYPHLSPLHPTNDSCNFQYFPVSSHGSYRGGKQFPFLHENSHASVYSAYPLMQLNSISSSASTSRNTQLFFDSDCAHSLLSSSSVNNPQPGFSISGTEHENAGTVFITDGNDVDFQCHSLFHVGVEGSLDGSRTLSFSCQ